MLDLMAAVVHAARIGQARVRRNADAACITITELADTLVREEGLTFRIAHHVAAATARAVIAGGVPLGAGFAAFRKVLRGCGRGRRPGHGVTWVPNRACNRRFPS